MSIYTTDKKQRVGEVVKFSGRGLLMTGVVGRTGRIQTVRRGGDSLSVVAGSRSD